MSSYFLCVVSKTTAIGTVKMNAQSARLPRSNIGVYSIPAKGNIQTPPNSTDNAETIQNSVVVNNMLQIGPVSVANPPGAAWALNVA